MQTTTRKPTWRRQMGAAALAGPQRAQRSPAGSVLLTTLVMGSVLCLTVGAMVTLSQYQVRSENTRWTSGQAFYHAENAMNWALQTIADSSVGGEEAPFLGNYSATAGTIGVSYYASLLADPTSGFKNAWVTIGNDPSGLSDVYLVTASAQVGAKARTVQTRARKNPPSLVFDYCYFLNNWGWWWGGTITGYGDVRANWDFDFRYNPTVNGAVNANGDIASNRVKVNPFSGTPPFSGLAGSDPVSYVHSGVPRVPMPNLLDFSYYAQKATNQGGQLWVGSTLVVNAVQSDTNQPGLYLAGTTSNPIKINGPVVVPGDVVIKGPITGEGTLYIGGNLYIAGDVTYLNGPSFTTPPSTMSQSDRDTWVNTAVAAGKDLVGFAVRGSILGGAVNSSTWQTYCYSASGYGLRNVGDESNLGPDGIAGTPDDGTIYLDTNGDGVPDSAWYDADGNGVANANYNYASDIQMTTARANKILNYPTTSGNPTDYNSVATANMNRLDGVYYCNHAAAMYLATANGAWNGSIISRNEAIVYTSSLKLVYDPRVHSHYCTDPNRFIDLGLPVAVRVRLQSFTEIKPVGGFYTGS